ncbi:MAG: hypothetical protein L0H63_09080 [Nitrococcus sp.]|nr:hypothetical protein [Nitrococcus sp.]
MILCGIAYGAFVLLASLAGGSSHTCADRDSCAAPVVAEQETPDSTVVRETALALTGDTGVSAYCPEYRDKIGGE